MTEESCGNHITSEMRADPEVPRVCSILERIENFRCTFTANRKRRFEVCGLGLEVVIVRAFRFK